MILEAMYLFLPAYFGNMFPVFAAILFHSHLDWPIDMGRSWRGKRITGNHKTWRGLVAGVLGGLFAVFLQKSLVGFGFWDSIALVDYAHASYLMGVVVGFSAVFGDVVKSFFKRRMGVPPGKNWVPFDQLDYVAGGLVGLFFFYVPSWQVVLTIVAASFVVHLVAGFISIPMKRYGNKKT